MERKGTMDLFLKTEGDTSGIKQGQTIPGSSVINEHKGRRSKEMTY